jgi:hypothetical protein
MDGVQHALDGHPRYERMKDLGSGTFGAVQLCKDKQSPDKPVACKLIPRGPKTVTEYVISEIRNFRCASSLCRSDRDSPRARGFGPRTPHEAC